MQRLVSDLRLAIAPITLLAALSGCTGSPIGDPCVPESIPEGGFDPREVYLETSSVQCRTRVCMVYQVSGNPERIDGTPSCDGDGMGCVSPQVAETQVFCSCRCQGPQEGNTPLCDCGDGFTCQEDVVTNGGDGVVGGYCVPCIREGDDRNLDSAVYEACPAD